MPPRLALATCRELPAHEHDDRPFEAALVARGASFVPTAWDDPDVDWSAFDAVLLRTTWDYQERIDDFERWIDAVARRTRLFNPPGIVRWNVRKDYLRDLEAGGVPVVPTRWLEAGTSPDLPALLDELGVRGNRRAFLKPVVGATARGTLPFASGDLDAARRHLGAWLGREAMMLQPFLDTVEGRGERSVILIDERPVHGVRKVPVPGDYRVQDDFGAHDEPDDPADLVEPARRAVAIARARCGVDAPLLYARADFLEDDEGRPRLIELELVEPSLFFRHGPAAADALAGALLARLDDASGG